MSQPDPNVLDEINPSPSAAPPPLPPPTTQLRTELDDANYRYYIRNESTLTDAAYDRKVATFKSAGN